MQVDHSPGPDLSGADAVKAGFYFFPPGDGDFVCIYPTRGAGDARSAQLNRYRMDATSTIDGWFRAASDDSQARMDAAEEGLHYVLTALEDDVRTKGGTLFAVDDIIDIVPITYDIVDGSQMDTAPGYGMFSLEVTVSYQATRGI